MDFTLDVVSTGKTFVSLYLALQDVLKHGTPYERVVIVRSLIPTREIGFLQAMRKIKLVCIKFHMQTWYSLCSNNQMKTHFRGLYDALKRQSSLHFVSTSFLRGLTFDNSIIIVDEC